MAQRFVRNSIVASHHPQRAFRILTNVLNIPKPVQLQPGSDNPALQVNDPMQSKYPEPTRVVGKGILYLAKASVVRADRAIIGRPIPGNKPNAVERVHI